MIHWHVKTFNQLTNDQLYEALKLRSDVFVVEQNCAYGDLDELDRAPGCLHVLGLGEASGLGARAPLVAYARLLAPALVYEGYSSIGRVIVNPQYRVKGLGHQLMQFAKAQTLARWPDCPIKIGAQAHLDKFYGHHGFEIIGETYLEDGIAHVHMVSDPAASS